MQTKIYANMYGYSDVEPAVDSLALLNAEISKLQTQADELKKTLRESGADVVLGTLHRAVISTVTTARLDTKLVRELLAPAAIDACTIDSTCTKVNLYDL